jgi:hypothetical protein
MVRGLLWLPLLAVFMGLAWAGWNEFQKLQAYQAWAQEFDRAKYDICAVLGQKGDMLVWGQPHRSGPRNLQEIFLSSATEIRLLVDGNVSDPLDPAQGKKIELEIVCGDLQSHRIPFTDIDLAVKWGQALSLDLPESA